MQTRTRTLIGFIIMMSFAANFARADICSRADNSKYFIRTEPVAPGKIQFEYCVRGAQQQCEKVGKRVFYDEATLRRVQDMVVEDANSVYRKEILWKVLGGAALVGFLLKPAQVTPALAALGVIGGGCFGGTAAAMGDYTMQQASMIENGIRATWYKFPHQCSFYDDNTVTLKEALDRILNAYEQKSAGVAERTSAATDPATAASKQVDPVEFEMNAKVPSRSAASK